jgi:mRNA interferase HigB
VNVISRKALKAFAERHRDAAEPLDNWYKRARKAHWQSLAEVKADYSHADLVGRCTVFNIGGNKYRLATKISYIGQAIYIKHALTHKEYDKGEWKDDC